jgi:haloalkane dehalogenase
MSTDQPIAAEFPFEAHFVEVHGARMHYVDEGSGDPVLFLHGNPTSSYLWRNIIPHLTDRARCIAPDLIGMGQSDKPDIAYRFFDHYKYLVGFIEALDLRNITLVIHDWGSGLGFHYAAKHPDNIKGIAFMEAICRPFSWATLHPQYKLMFRLMRLDGIGWLLVSALNLFVNQLLPGAVARKLTAVEMQHYRAPYPTVRSRRPVRQWPREVPIDGKPVDVAAAVETYSQWLQETDLPKILFHAQPAAIISADGVAWLKAHLSNLTTVDIGPGIHFIQEDNPHLIGTELAAWVAGL